VADQKNEPVGVGGCLGFFVIGLIVIGPLFGWVSTSTGLRDSEAAFPQLVGTSAWGQYKLISWVAFFTQAILSIHAGVRLNHETKPGAVRYAIFILWFSTIGINALFFLALFTIPDYGAATAEAYTRDPAFVGQILGQAIAAGVWTVYLLTSRRVRNTYYAGQSPKSVAASDPGSYPSPDPEAVSANTAQIAPATEAPTVGQSEQPNSGPDEQFVLYDERFDWLAMYLIALVPLWLGYSFKVGLILLPAFALIAALKPMRLRLGSLTWSGIFAAGASLLLSPILLMAAQDGGSDLFDDVSVSDEALNGIRAFVYPAAGIAIMVHAWSRAPRFRDANGSLPKRIRFWRWLGFAVAGLVLAAFAAGSLLQAHQGRMEYEAHKKLIELEKQRKQIAKAMPLSPVTRKWLVGEWEWKAYGSCYDGLNFRASGTFSSGEYSGEFSLSGDGRTLKQRYTNCLLCLPDPITGRPNLPPPETLRVGRRGEKLIIGQSEYRRCP